MSIASALPGSCSRTALQSQECAYHPSRQSAATFGDLYVQVFEACPILGQAQSMVYTAPPPQAVEERIPNAVQVWIRSFLTRRRHRRMWLPDHKHPAVYSHQRRATIARPRAARFIQFRNILIPTSITKELVLLFGHLLKIRIEPCFNWTLPRQCAERMDRSNKHEIQLA